jgi:hypothetical protein
LALRICADRGIIFIERGADWVRNCRTKYFFLGCGMINSLYGISWCHYEFGYDCIECILTAICCNPCTLLCLAVLQKSLPQAYSEAHPVRALILRVLIAVASRLSRNFCFPSLHHMQ